MDHRSYPPYVMHALEVFGEDRVVFGSDWPVCTLATPYARWVETLDELTADWTDAARAKLWRENAIRFYRLDCLTSTVTERPRRSSTIPGCRSSKACAGTTSTNSPPSRHQDIGSVRVSTRP